MCSGYKGTLADAPEPLPVTYPSSSCPSSSSGKQPSRKQTRSAREKASAGPSWVSLSASGQLRWEEPNLPDILKPHSLFVTDWQEVDMNSERIKSGIVDPGYRFPKPMLFINMSMPERKKTYLLNWLSAHPLWINQVDNHPPSKFPSPQMWRDFLNTIDTDPLPLTKTVLTKLAITELKELLEPFCHLSISSSDIFVPAINPCDIAEPSSPDVELSTIRSPHCPESPSLSIADIPSAFKLDKSFAPPPDHQELSLLTDLSHPVSSSASTFAAEQLLLPSTSFTASQNPILLLAHTSLPIPQYPLPLSLSFPTAMSATTNHHKMPLRGSNKAPKFLGKTEDICAYFEDVDQICTDMGITNNRVKIRWAICYADRNESELWSSLDSAMGDDWGDFTREVTSFYPGANVKGQQYTKADLETLLHHQVQKPMSSLEDLSKYMWEFC
ncbi:hypothetical protein EDD16DRAFT_1714041 [Pisolithus croceorrhizus]|nr:hypothetical protein EDD16DRAFT_1714041 [Pisolithus croceorrhizus]